MTESEEYDQESLHNHDNEKIFLEVPYDQRKTAKHYGAKWDPEKKKWFVTWIQHEIRGSEVSNYFIHYLEVPYDKKDEYKAKGCKWDTDLKKWYTYRANPHFDKDNLYGNK